MDELQVVPATQPGAWGKRKDRSSVAKTVDIIDGGNRFFECGVAEIGADIPLDNLPRRIEWQPLKKQGLARSGVGDLRSLRHFFPVFAGVLRMAEKQLVRELRFHLERQIEDWVAAAENNA